MLKNILVFCIIFSLPCLSQWRWINPTTGNFSINEIKFYDNFVTLSGERGRILISNDNSMSWQDYSDYGRYSIIKSHFLNLDTAFVLKCFKYHGYFGNVLSTKFKLTTDKGKNWNDIIFTQYSGFIQDIVIYKNNIWLSFYEGAGCLWLGNYLYHSSDYGNSWSEFDARVLGYCSNMIALNDSTIILQSDNVRISYDKFVVKSTDYGKTWNYKHNLGYYVLYDLRKIDNDFIIGVGYDGIIVKSSDQGESWETSFLADKVKLIKITGNKSNLLALAETDHKNFIYRFTNEGLSWNKVFATNKIFNTIESKSSNEVWLGGAGGQILISSDSGITWNKYNYIFNQDFNSVCFKSELEGFIVGDSGKILKTKNGGKSWFYMQSPTDSDLVYITFYPNGNLGFLVSSDGKIFKTTNCGSNWTTVYNDITKKVRQVAFITEDQIIAVGDTNLVLLSTNSGESWVVANKNIDLSGKYTNISIPAPNCIYVGFEEVIYKTIDTAKTWSKFYRSSNKILSFDFPKTNLGYIVTAPYNDYFYIYKTTNEGANWDLNTVNLALQDQSNFKLVFLNDSSGYLIGSVLMSTTNYGLNWDIDYNINGNDIYVHKNMDAWVVGNYGAIISNVKADVIVIVPIYEITEHKLHQNYPNPFNAGTTIEYEIPNDGYVVLKIYNILGEEIDRLVDKYQIAGKYSFLWKPHNLPSGIYIYSLQAGNYIIARKMCLIK